ncbi:MAG: hypothetical protein P9L93_01055 [Candidatus Gorgyraea atricola]|nr:hypothetical protein [Candidatus Gorgyraea atricola]
MLENLGKKEKTEIAITAIGIVFLIFMVIGNVQKFQTKKASMAKKQDVVTSSLSVPISFEAPEIEETTIKEGWGHDPFTLGSAGAGDIELEGLVLNGIMWDPANPLAIINSDVIKVGDSLGTATVVEITQNSVILEQDSQRHTLNLVAY